MGTFFPPLPTRRAGADERICSSTACAWLESPKRWHNKESSSEVSIVLLRYERMKKLRAYCTELQPCIVLSQGDESTRQYLRTHFRAKLYLRTYSGSKAYQ